MELAEREGQADCGGNPGMMRALGKRAMNRRCVGIGMDCSYCPPSAAVRTQKGRIYITYRRTDRTTKDSLAQQVWVRERRESTTEPIFRALCAASLIFPSYSASLSGAPVKCVEAARRFLWGNSQGPSA